MFNSFKSVAPLTTPHKTISSCYINANKKLQKADRHDMIRNIMLVSRDVTIYQVSQYGVKNVRKT